MAGKKRASKANGKAKSTDNGHGNTENESKKQKIDEELKEKEKESTEEEKSSHSEDTNSGSGSAGSSSSSSSEDVANGVKMPIHKAIKKSGDLVMKICSFNVGGLKAWAKKGGFEFILNEKDNFDVVCIQEIRTGKDANPFDGVATTSKGGKKKHEGLISAELHERFNQVFKYRYWNYNKEQPGHHGVAIFSRIEPVNVEMNLPVDAAEFESDKRMKSTFNKYQKECGRIQALEFDHKGLNFSLVNAYIPNSGQGVKVPEHKKPYPAKIVNGERLDYDKIFTQYLKQLQAKHGGDHSVIVTGDLNVAHEEIDLANPKTNTATAGFTKEEREDFSTLLKETNLVDTFRAFNPDVKGQYTFWSYRTNARPKNIGWRLDYFLAPKDMMIANADDENEFFIMESRMQQDVQGSDHCPILLEIGSQ